MAKVTARQVSGQPQTHAGLAVIDAGPFADPRFRYVIVDGGKVVAGFARSTQAEAYRMHLGIVRRRQ